MKYQILIIADKGKSLYGVSNKMSPIEYRTPDYKNFDKFWKAPVIA